MPPAVSASHHNTGIALAGLILNNRRATAKSITKLRQDLNALAERVSRDIAALDEKLSRRITDLGERVARLEGFIEGIRDAIAGKAA